MVVWRLRFRKARKRMCNGSFMSGSIRKAAEPLRFDAEHVSCVNVDYTCHVFGRPVVCYGDGQQKLVTARDMRRRTWHAFSLESCRPCRLAVNVAWYVWTCDRSRSFVARSRALMDLWRPFVDMLPARAEDWSIYSALVFIHFGVATMWSEIRITTKRNNFYRL